MLFSPKESLKQEKEVAGISFSISLDCLAATLGDTNFSSFKKIERYKGLYERIQKATKFGQDTGLKYYIPMPTDKKVNSNVYYFFSLLVVSSLEARDDWEEVKTQLKSSYIDTNIIESEPVIKEAEKLGSLIGCEKLEDMTLDQIAKAIVQGKFDYLNENKDI